MTKRRQLLHRDSIHHDTVFDPLSTALIDSASLQRLGRVLQLGYAHLVYRGGTHTRLSHVMGASHMSVELVKNLRNNYADDNARFCPVNAVRPNDFLPFRRSPNGGKTRDNDRISARWEFLEYVCRWAALLHDIGHIPLGHTLEDEFDQVFKKHDDLGNPRLASLWMDQDNSASEVREILRNKSLYPKSFLTLGVTQDDVFNTVLLICCHKEEREGENRPGRTFTELLSQQQTEFEKYLSKALALQCQAGRDTFSELMADLVANTICADYLDYMQRDPYFVGLDVLRDERVASRFYVGRHERWGDRMALSLVDRHGKRRTDTASGVFELVRQRFRFAETIYYHKAKVSASAMFVKALTLIKAAGVRIDAHGRTNPTVALGNIDEIVRRYEGLKPEDALAFVRTLVDEHMPSNLLSPDLGDDSLNLYLQGIAWDQAKQLSTSGGNAKGFRECVLAISLLGGIARRRLYKLALAFDGDQIRRLAGHEPGLDDRLAQSIKAVIDHYRPNHELRSRLEDQMCDAANFRHGSIILYVPGRKSQAKGVETFALNGADMVTLGLHPTLKTKMEELNRDYSELWRFLVFVHPDYSDNWEGISPAVDVLVKDILNTLGKNARSKLKEDVRTVLGEAARGPYVSAKDRQAVKLFLELCSSRKFDEAMAFTFNAVSGQANSGGSSLGSEEHADLAYLLWRVLDERNDDLSEDSVKAGIEFEKLCSDGALKDRLKQMKPLQLEIEGYSGQPERKRALLEELAAELRDAKSRRTVSKK